MVSKHAPHEPWQVFAHACWGFAFYLAAVQAPAKCGQNPGRSPARLVQKKKQTCEPPAFCSRLFLCVVTRALEGAMSQRNLNHRSERFPMQAAYRSSWAQKVRPLRL